MKNISFYSILLLFIIINNTFGASNPIDIDEIIQQARNNMYQHPKEAIEYAKLANRKAAKLNNNSLIFDSKILLGTIYSLNGNYDLALEAYINAESYLDYNDTLSIADYNINMGSMYFSLDNFYKAHIFNNTAFQIYQQLQDSIGMGWCLNLKGLIYTHEKKYDLAQQAMESSLTIYRHLDYKDGIYIVFNNLAMIPGDEEQKIENIKKAINYNLNTQQKWSLAENYNNLASIYIRIKDYNKASEYLRKAEQIADTIDANIIKRDNIEYAMKIAIAQNRYKDAYEYYLKIDEINKEINSIDKVQQIEDDAYKQKQLMQQYNLQKKEAALQIARQEKTNLFISGILILIIIVLIIRVIHLRKVNKLTFKAKAESQKKLQLKKELETKNSFISNQAEKLNITKKEMTDLVYFIKSKDKLLDNVVTILKEAQKKSVEDPKIKIKSIILLINNFREKELKTDLFINEIKKSEEEFLKRVNQAHNELSKNEVTLATLLRIGLSSKEIALLIDSNPKTVNMARYRLRKKLNLETDENLIDYFESL